MYNQVNTTGAVGLANVVKGNLGWAGSIRLSAILLTYDPPQDREER